ncbi:MAG: tetratricopeptide repeat protein [Chloroflexi bacterium]|nr:tetratricopeptide repeat protein [Chloroflexota bacterium]
MYSPLELAAAFIQAGELDEALDALNTYLAAHADDARVRRWRIGVLRRMESADHLRAALADLDQLAALTADDHIHRSVIHERLGDQASAISALRAGHAQHPDDHRITERLLQLLFAHDDLDEAAAILAALPPTWRWLTLSGDLAVRRGDAQTALAHYSAALTDLERYLAGMEPIFADGLRANLLFKRAHLYRDRDQFDDAAADYRAAEQIIPDDPLLPFNRGLLAYLRGDDSEAIRLCRAALDSAAPALHDHMTHVLGGDARFAELWQTLR